MNCCIILLFFLLCGNCGGNFLSGNDNDCNNRSGCGDRRPCPKPEPRCGCDDKPVPPRREDNRPCDDSRFEPRFESRPFSGGPATCGCEENERN